MLAKTLAIRVRLYIFERKRSLQNFEVKSWRGSSRFRRSYEWFPITCSNGCFDSKATSNSTGTGKGFANGTLKNSRMPSTFSRLSRRFGSKTNCVMCSTWPVTRAWRPSRKRLTWPVRKTSRPICRRKVFIIAQLGRVSSIRNISKTRCVSCALLASLGGGNGTICRSSGSMSIGFS